MSLNILGNVCSHRSSISSANWRFFWLGGFFAVIEMGTRSEVARGRHLMDCFVCGYRRNKGVNIIFGAGWLRGVYSPIIAADWIISQYLPRAAATNEKPVSVEPYSRGTMTKNSEWPRQWSPFNSFSAQFWGFLLPLAVHPFLKGTDALSNLGLSQAGQFVTADVS